MHKPLTNVIIRRSKPGDESSLFEIHMRALKEICSQIYSSKQVEAIVNGKTANGYLNIIKAEGDNTIYVACVNDQILSWMHAKKGEIFGLFTSPDRIMGGAGKALVQFAQTNLKDENGSIILEATLNALPFYRKMGFIPVSGGNTTRMGIEIPIVKMEWKSKE